MAGPPVKRGANTLAAGLAWACMMWQRMTTCARYVQEKANSTNAVRPSLESVRPDA